MTGASPAISQPVYSGKFIRKVILGCFVDYVFLSIHNKTLFIYNNSQHYRNKPSHPVCFFNLSHTEFVLEEESLRMRSRCDEMVLRHDNPDRLLELLSHINTHRNNTGVQQIYPRKFAYLNESLQKESAL